FFRSDDLEQRMEMCAHQVEGGKVADAFVKRSRALQVRKQESQRGDLQALVGIEIVRLEDVAEGLVGQHPLGGEDGLSLAEQAVKRVVGQPDRGKHAMVRLIFQRKPQWPGAHLRRSGRRLQLVEDNRKLLPFAGRLALNVDEMS